mgnify:CR=1 FL=1
MNATCPKCHGKIVSLSPIINTETTEIYGYHGYCCSLKCKVRRVTFDKNFNAVGFTKWSSLDKKKEYLYRTLKTNRKNGNWTYRKKTEKKWQQLKKYLK